jgi:F-type H+-transporting ATPase subunit beta
VEEVPAIYDALEITKENGEKVVLEVEQHIGEDTVRCIAMDATDGLKRGQGCNRIRKSYYNANR